MDEQIINKYNPKLRTVNDIRTYTSLKVLADLKTPLTSRLRRFISAFFSTPDEGAE